MSTVEETTQKLVNIFSLILVDFVLETAHLPYQIPLLHFSPLNSAILTEMLPKIGKCFKLKLVSLAGLNEFDTIGIVLRIISSTCTSP